MQFFLKSWPTDRPKEYADDCVTAEGGSLSAKQERMHHGSGTETYTASNDVTQPADAVAYAAASGGWTSWPPCAWKVRRFIRNPTQSSAFIEIVAYS